MASRGQESEPVLLSSLEFGSPRPPDSKPVSATNDSPCSAASVRTPLRASGLATRPALAAHGFATVKYPTAEWFCNFPCQEPPFGCLYTDKSTGVRWCGLRLPTCQSPWRRKHMCKPRRTPTSGLGASATAESGMVKASVMICCVICGHRWKGEAILQDDGSYLVVDDLCPECGAQGDPAEVAVRSESDRPRGEDLGSGPVRTHGC